MGGIVEVEHARHQFGSLVVIDDLSFELSEGGALGVVGPNGAGKTTMLNVVAGDLRPRSGTVRLQGRDVTRMAANGRCRLGIGRTSQIPRVAMRAWGSSSNEASAIHQGTSPATPHPMNAAIAASCRPA